jgi:hypothetical protein
VTTQRLDFAEFYRISRDDCLRTILVITGDRDSAQELVAEAFTLTSNSNGTDTLTVTNGELTDPAALQRALAEHGIPALVKINTICQSNHAPPLGKVLTVETRTAPPCARAHIR